MKKKVTPSLLWKVAHPQLDTISYLFGTMHVKDLKAFRYFETVKSKIRSSEAFAMEVNFNELQAAWNKSLVTLPEGTKLSDYLSEKQMLRVQKMFIKIAGHPLGNMDRLPPIMLINYLSTKVLAEDQPLHLDAMLWKYAESLDKKLYGVEEVDFQQNLLRQIPLAYQLKSLKDLSKNYKGLQKKHHIMAEAYERGDLKAISKMSKKSAGLLRKILIYQRNIKMADSIFELMQKHSIVCGVGAGHLSGKQGIIRLLKQKACKLKNIPPSI